MRIREHVSKAIHGDTAYVVWICGEERVDGTWQGWLEFHPTDTALPILRTGQETSQPNRAVDLSQSTWSVRSPVLRDDFSGRLLPNSP
jgi:hypothetical protein